MPLNRGTSWLRNLHRLTLMMDLSISMNSSSLGNLCFRLAAVWRWQARHVSLVNYSASQVRLNKHAAQQSSNAGS